MQREISQSHAETSNRGIFSSLSRFLVTILATVMFLASPVSLPAQQPARTGSQAAKASQGLAGEDASIRPFRVQFPKATLTDLRQRIAATRWPDRETVSDASQGAQLENLRELVRYWGTQYDWRKAEAKLNAYPQFMTKLDGLDIHFIHVRSRHPNALPLIITHGWPGSVFEQLKLIGPLTDPTAFDGRAEDAFNVVIPSLPGYGFSAQPTEAGWGLERIARAWDVLMKRLGYTRYVAQGGDWGAGIVEAMGRQSPTVDDVLDDFTLYWLTNSAASSARIYWESRELNLISAASQKTDEIKVPVAITVFPDEVYQAPETWARRAFRKLIYFHEADRGGHFAAWEYPELFAAELRAAFKSLR